LLFVDFQSLVFGNKLNFFDIREISYLFFEIIDRNLIDAVFDKDGDFGLGFKIV